MVDEGKFRADLFYRIGVFPIQVPPLRHRHDDIPMLVWFFVERLCSRLGRTIDSIPDEVMRRFKTYQWPGNIRELQNTIERAMILSPGRKLEIGDTLLNQRHETQEQKSDRGEPRMPLHTFP